MFSSLRICETRIRQFTNDFYVKDCKHNSSRSYRVMTNSTERHSVEAIHLYHETNIKRSGDIKKIYKIGKWCPHWNKLRPYMVLRLKQILYKVNKLWQIIFSRRVKTHNEKSEKFSMFYNFFFTYSSLEKISCNGLKHEMISIRNNNNILISRVQTWSQSNFLWVFTHCFDTYSKFWWIGEKRNIIFDDWLR